MAVRTPVKHLATPKKERTETEYLALGEFPIRNRQPRGKQMLGEVMAYDKESNSYTVIGRGEPGGGRKPGGQQYRGVGRKTEAPGTVTQLALGTPVVLNFTLGFPYIDGVLKVDEFPANLKGPNAPPKVGGSKSRTASPITPGTGGSSGGGSCAGYYRSPGEPDDTVPGDKILITPDGNWIGALRGKESTLFGGVKAQIRCLGAQELIQVYCEDYELYTGFGQLVIANEEGRSGLRFDAAPDQKTESGGKEKLWRFSVEIGDAGDFFSLQVKGADGSLKSKIHISADGQLTLLGTNGVHIINGGKSPSFEEVAGPVIRKYQNTVSEEIGGAVAKTLNSTLTENISESRNVVIGHNDGAMINNHQIVSIGGMQDWTINGGDPATCTPASVAADIKVINGSYIIRVGNSKLGAGPAAIPGFRAFVHNGEALIGEDPNPANPTTYAMVSLNTTLPNSIGLGCVVDPANMFYAKNPGGALHAAMFEPLQILFNTLIPMLDAHTHTCASPGSPTSPALAPANPGGFSAAISNAVITAIMSKRVVIGL